MPKFQNLAGERFGCCVAIDYHPITSTRPYALWRCKTDCGEERYKQGTALRKERCLCRKREAISKSRKRHGRSNSAEYRAWMGMKARCYNPNHGSYEHYGERGIIVCDEWKNTFEKFFADMGERPSKIHSLDRIDNNGIYEKDNCRWATRIQQVRNRSCTRLFTFKNETLSAAEWGRRLGGSAMLVTHRIGRGWDYEKAFTTPAGGKQ